MYFEHSEYPDNIWKYISRFKYMPKYEDRKKLEEKASQDKEHEKRVKIWDYFFRIDFSKIEGEVNEEIDNITRNIHGKRGELRENDNALHRKKSRISSLASEISKSRARKRLYAILCIVTIFAAFFAFSYAEINERGAQLGVLLLMFCTLFGLGYLSATSNMGQLEREMLSLEQESRKLEEEIRDVRRTITSLELDLKRWHNKLEQLRSQLPDYPSTDEVYTWLSQDINSLKDQVTREMGFAGRLLEFKDGVPNPLVIMSPAAIQNRQEIPDVFFEDENKKKHLFAARYDYLSDGRIVDLYGVYYFEFIFIGEDMLGIYTCVYDFIEGVRENEFMSEQYYHDIVSLAIERKRLQRSIVEEEDEYLYKLPEIERLPTFRISLTSGEVRQISFATHTYFEGLQRF